MTEPVIVICTRPDSVRLPGKALRPIAGRPAIEHILARTQGTYRTILAVPEGCDAYDEIALRWSVDVYRGNGDNPLARMAEAALSRCISGGRPDYVVRITHDDLLIDRQEMVALVDHVRRIGAGYGWSPGILEGAGVEVIHTENLWAALERADRPVEHVSYFVKGMAPNKGVAPHTPRAGICRPYCLTMDYPEDALVLDLILRQLGPDATNEAICDFLDMNPYVLHLNRRPLVSVYTCAKNAERFVADAVDSVLMNDYRDMEYIFVDDGSTDDTALIAARCMARDNRRFKLLLNDRNLGLASSSNRAIAEARGKYVLRVDADDVLLRYGLYALVNEAERRNADIVYPDCRRRTPDGSELHERGCRNHHAGGALMRRAFINALWFKEGLRWWDGLELHKRAADVGRIVYLNQAAFIYRRHEGNITNVGPERQQAAVDLGLTTTAAPVHDFGTHIIERGL